MSVTVSNKFYKNSLHWKNDSGELDVFEAARYFSGANENPNNYGHGTKLSQKFTQEDNHQHQNRRVARMSLDMALRNQIPTQNHAINRKGAEKNKKHKQPSSPGGRLASFLNSLFTQTNSRKYKSKSVNLEEENPNNGRKKRPSTVVGSTTTPPYANTPIKPDKEIKTMGGDFKSTSMHNGFPSEKIRVNYACVDQKFSFRNSNFLKNGGFSDSSTDPSEEKEFRKFSDVDDGADSDSSSDLFDLPNHELDLYSDDLPVYETTHVSRIRRSSATFSRDAMV